MPCDIAMTLVSMSTSSQIMLAPTGLKNVIHHLWQYDNCSKPQTQFQIYSLNLGLLLGSTTTHYTMTWIAPRLETG
jgi:hypothetical protein